MAKRADIEARLSLDSSGFKNGLKKSKASVQSFVSGATARLGALAGAAGFGALVKGAVDMAAEISNLSKLSGTGEEEFQKMAYAAKSVGVEQEKLGDILKDVSDKVGDFLQTGGGPLKDFFENIAPKVGVTAEQFRNLSGKDALQLYVSSLEKANVSQNEMTFFMEAIASDATLLLPLLKDNGQALTELGAEAKKLGLIMEEETIAKLKTASIQINKFKRGATILTGVFVTKAVPALSILGQGLRFVGDVAGVSAANFLAFGRTIGSVLSAVVAPAISQLEALGLAIKAAGQFASRDFAGAKESIKGAKDQVSETIDEIKAIPKAIGDAFTQLGEDQKSAWEVLGDAVDDRATAIEKNLNDIKGAATETAEEVEKVGGDGTTTTGGGTVTKSKASSSTSSTSSTSFDAADTNNSGIVTGRESRAAAKAKRKADSEARRMRTVEVAMGNKSRASKAGGMTMDEIKQMEMTKEGGTVSETNRILKSIDKEIKANP